MPIFRNLRISTKIIAVLGLMAVLSASVAMFAAYTISSLAETTKHVVDREGEALRLAAAAQEHFTRMHQLAFEINGRGYDLSDALRSRFAAERKAMNSDMDEFNLAMDAQEAPMSAAIEAQAARYDETYNADLNLLKSGKLAEADASLRSAGGRVFDRADAAYDLLVAKQISDLNRGAVVEHDQARTALWLMVWASIAGLLGVGAVALFIVRRQVTEPLAAITSAMGQLAAGDLQVCQEGVDRRDEIGDLSRAFGAFRQAALEKRAMEAAAAEQRRQLEQSEARYRLLAENSTDAILCYDADRRFTFVSPAFTRMLGYAPEEMIGECISALMHPDDVAALKAEFTAFRTAGPGGEPIHLEFRAFHKDGRMVWLEARPTAIFDEITGDFIEFQDDLRDITVQREAAAAARKSEGQFRRLVRGVTDYAIYMLDPGGVVTNWNDGAERAKGYTAEEIVGRNFEVFYTPEDRERGEPAKSLAKARAEGRFDAVGWRMRKNGERFWANVVIDAIYDDEGELIGFAKITRDITRQKADEDRILEMLRAQREISQTLEETLAKANESEFRYRTIAENATDMISRTGVNGRFIYMSPSVTDVMGWKAEDLIGRGLIPYMHPDDVAPSVAFYEQVIAGSRPENSPLLYRARHRDGHWVWLECNPTLVRDAKGAPAEFIDITRDVSARVRLEAEIRAARDAAEAASVTKTEFLANMSHEIRTPLTAILGFAGLLAERSDLDETAQTYVRRITGAGTVLRSVVNDVLDFSKLEAGLIELRPTPVSAADILRDTLLTFSHEAEAKGLSLAFEDDGLLPPYLMIDPERLRQILFNLLSNAIKFTETGSIAVGASYAAKSGRLSVRIEDTGAGLTKVQQQRLFQRFSQVDGSSTRRHGGSGLGLAICKGLVEAMGGEIGVRSKPGRGSVFHFRIAAPRAEALPVVIDDEAEISFEGVRILVADDNPTNLELVRAILTPFGVELTEVADGMAAVEAAHAAPFDLILMDVRMPRLDGRAATIQIRRGGGPNEDIPILAFSADTRAGDLAEAGAYFDGFVRKPLVPEELLSTLANHLQPGADAETLMETQDAASV